MEAELPKHRSAKEFTCPHQQGSRLEYFGSLRTCSWNILVRMGRAIWVDVKPVAIIFVINISDVFQQQKQRFCTESIRDLLQKPEATQPLHVAFLLMLAVDTSYTHFIAVDSF
ncbi:hypothetical protein SORBI_3010G105050 [Sorghum bicolor]|uniref:Uncharacterized protein n=1 Tax=Sorghum bicolor TaxID=4558 RepID=A0A1W0VSB5_SORBI|nr:hypothetical protein SORBI_3010G105050 [Sorghum bicolor]